MGFRTFYHGSPVNNITELRPGSWVSGKRHVAEIMGRYHLDTGRTWTDDDLRRPYSFTKNIYWKDGREPKGVGSLYKIRFNTEDMDMLNNKSEHRILKSAPVEKIASINYRGYTFPGYNKPIPSDRKNKKKVVLARVGETIKMIHYGDSRYSHNYSPEAKANYLSRAKGIRDKDGKLTSSNKLSANYWAIRDLWPSGEADGSSKYSFKKENS